MGIRAPQTSKGITSCSVTPVARGSTERDKTSRESDGGGATARVKSSKATAVLRPAPCTSTKFGHVIHRNETLGACCASALASCTISFLPVVAMSRSALIPLVEFELRPLPYVWSSRAGTVSWQTFRSYVFKFKTAFNRRRRMSSCMAAAVVYQWPMFKVHVHSQVSELFPTVKSRMRAWVRHAIASAGTARAPHTSVYTTHFTVRVRALIEYPGHP